MKIRQLTQHTFCNTTKNNIMAIQKLLDILPPPQIPYPNIKIDWDKVEKELGRKLPTDYKDFIDYYGYVIISDELIIYLPIGKSSLEIFF